MPAARVSHLAPKENGTAGATTELQSVSDAGDEKTPYERVLYGNHHDPKWVKEVSLGRRVGFYRFRGELGRGNFSTVRLAHHQLTKDKVAVKVIEKAKLDQKTQRMLAREIANMDIVAHPNIIRLFEVVETLSRIHLVLEFAPAGELFNRVSTEGRLGDSDARLVFSQVLSAIVYLHSLHIIHRDIKAENVFQVTYKRVKLGDFGFSTRVPKDTDQLATFCGSPPYAAPELYKDESYEGTAVDTWALGVLLFFLLTADMPFKASTVAGLKRQILAGSFLIPLYVTDNARELINKLMVQCPPDRLSPDKVLSHAWFRGSELSSSAAPAPLPKWVTFPRTLDSSCPQGGLTPEEETAFRYMTDWGLPRRSVVQCGDQGARSPVIATYRILLHRLLHSEEAAGDTGEEEGRGEGGDGGSTPPENKSPGGSRPYSPRKLKLRLRNGLRKPNSTKSKTCIVI